MFICLSCSGIHRNIPQVSKVKSVRLDAWEEAQVEVWACERMEVAVGGEETLSPAAPWVPLAWPPRSDTPGVPLPRCLTGANAAGGRRGER